MKTLERQVIKKKSWKTKRKFSNSNSNEKDRRLFRSKSMAFN